MLSCLRRKKHFCKVIYNGLWVKLYALAKIVVVWIDLLILMPITSGIAASLSFTGQLGELVDVLSG